MSHHGSDVDPMYWTAAKSDAFHEAARLAFHGIQEVSRGACDVARHDYNNARKAFRLADLMAPGLEVNARGFAAADLRSLAARLRAHCPRRGL